jgi:hypothetical protein
VLAQQVEHMRERIALEQQLCERLEGVQRWLRSTGKVSVDALIESMELTMKIESHYTAEQLEYLKQRRAQLGEDRSGGGGSLPTLIVRCAMEKERTRQ